MKLVVKENINEILNINEEDNIDTIKCFQYIPHDKKYKFYIFTCYYKTELELNTNFQNINDIIAYEFQRKLLLDIEKWNLYIFFFVKEGITENLKELIEQNKYSTRKIVYDNFTVNFSDEKIEEIILNKLFVLDIAGNESNEKFDVKLPTLIDQKDITLMDLIIDIKNIKGRNQKEIKEKRINSVQKYLELKRHD